MSSHLPQRRPANAGSILLTHQENDCLYNYLGRKCIALCSAVVQVYKADRNSSWVKKCCGVACLVKDNPQRSYFIRVFDIKEGKTVFEQELYYNFSMSCSRPYFVSFAGDTCQLGLNFASEEEAKQFWAATNDLISKRQRKTEKRRDPPNGPALPMATVDIKNPEISNMRFHNNSQVNNMVHSSFSKDKRKSKGKRKKLTKADIGTPSNFQHIGHVGWDPNTGFDLNNLDPELKNLFDMCGISEAQLKDKETSKVIYDFIEKKGGVEAVKNELRRQAPPPPPSRGGPPPPPPHHTSGPPPPPPPARGRGAPPPPPPSRAPHVSSPAPAPASFQTDCRKPTSTPASDQRPPATSASARARLPSPTGGATAASPLHPRTLQPAWRPGSSPVGGKSALLDQIRGGANLKKVEQNNKPQSGVGRDALLDQIRQGFQLKTVADSSEPAPPTPAPSAGIVGALMEAMQQRSRAIHSSDEDEDDEDDEDFEDEDEWED
ncbi:hypothetical protein SKAU_G00024590 [Synaphobranchus kaupii]|uniref:Neural Wiskott-Aldrich syndrome protein n=1 Tax=Synaphobranchus kaupii TaxID=118154 RepID=A0A9Q1GDR0_SYNKA|nr:hypothetical protein SKAU_G00024590 [Synaphobranchus kaupii]